MDSQSMMMEFNSNGASQTHTSKPANTNDKDASSSTAHQDVPFSIHPSEARITEASNVLIVLSSLRDVETEIVNSFCGIVITDPSELMDVRHKSVYLCGDISKGSNLGLQSADRVFIIKEHSYGFHNATSSWKVIESGRVPLLVNGVGVLYRRFFNSELSLFNKLSTEHSFQSLRESNKPGVAHRTGIYLTPVVRDGDDVHFNLLRCSSNFSGPTSNFRAYDQTIVNALNQESKFVFENSAPFNHVLAQIYHNTPAAGRSKKETKATIKEHSDKTKDMPRNAVIAFCTFYDTKGLDRLHPMGADGLDYGFKGVSGLTKLYFRLKPGLTNRADCDLRHDFSVTLYPDSVFFIPLSTNRMYTHEIRPGALNAELLPTRMGYVVRCSNAEAVHRGRMTYLKLNDQWVPMQPPTAEVMFKLRQKYAEENATAAFIDYGEVLFSMNKGDYEKPLVYDDDVPSKGFQLFHVDETEECDLYSELLKSAVMEDVCKGRKGAVLVKPDELRGVPIVRTTTKYHRPAQCFKPVHDRLTEQIQEQIQRSASSLPGFRFNNALIEHYDEGYATMGFHSDQALDLEEDSYIALFSCYKNPSALADTNSAPRKLIVQSKEGTGPKEPTEIPMLHNSVIIFSMETNKTFQHKIVLDSTAEGGADNPWIGVTFRVSKTFVRFNGGEVFFQDGTPLRLANRQQSQEFFRQRKLENRQESFRYENIDFTISKSDLVLPHP